MIIHWFIQKTLDTFMFFNLKNKNVFTLEWLCTKKIFTGNVLKGKNKEKMNVIFDFATFIIVIFFFFHFAGKQCN